jgi:uncharacterized integral membrane protein
MIPLGLLLVIAAGVVGVAVAMDNTDPATVAAFGQSYGTTTTGVFLAGAVTGAVLMAGLALMIAGARRHRVRRRVARSEVRDARVENDQLAEENARLRAQVDSDPYPTETTTGSGRHTVR